MFTWCTKSEWCRYSESEPIEDFFANLNGTFDCAADAVNDAGKQGYPTSVVMILEV
jgi:hypothetical protein